MLYPLGITCIPLSYNHVLVDNVPHTISYYSGDVDVIVYTVTCMYHDPREGHLSVYTNVVLSSCYHTK